MNNKMIDWALTYAIAYDFHIFPNLPDFDMDDATNDEHQIRAWWSQYPNAQIKVATGPSRLLIFIGLREIWG